MSACMICDGWGALPHNYPKEHIFLEGFFLGVFAQRILTEVGSSVTEHLCADHLRMGREIALKIPVSVVGPPYRHLLSLGLHVVSIEKET